MALRSIQERFRSIKEYIVQSCSGCELTYFFYCCPHAIKGHLLHLFSYTKQKKQGLVNSYVYLIEKCRNQKPRSTSNTILDEIHVDPTALQKWGTSPQDLREFA